MFLRRQVELEDTSPLEATPAGRAEHVGRIDEALVAAREGRGVRLPERPRATVRDVVSQPATLSTEIFGDDELGRLASSAAEAGERGREAAAAGGVSPSLRRPDVAPEPSPPPQRAPLGRRALADEGDLSLDTPEGRAADDLLEQEVRRLAAEDPEARVTLEDGDTVRALTARELVEELDQDKAFEAAVKDCLGAA